ncbi:MAG: DUF1150 family protein [Amylibacter sp.]|nr:DUF1150 family protein [Amylibacter sp.]
MNTKFDFAKHGIERTVYVRKVAHADLPEDMQVETKGHEVVYAIHSEDGARLALVKDRALAFAVARTNDYTPVSVH